MAEQRDVVRHPASRCRGFQTYDGECATRRGDGWNGLGICGMVDMELERSIATGMHEVVEGSTYLVGKWLSVDN